MTNRFLLMPLLDNSSLKNKKLIYLFSIIKWDTIIRVRFFSLNWYIEYAHLGGVHDN